MASYPTSLYDRGEELLAALGSFWYNTFTDAAKLEQFYRGYMLEAGQTYSLYRESVDAVSRYKIPLFHTENWYFLTFLQSEMSLLRLHYGDGAVYGEQPDDSLAETGKVFQYGIPYSSTRPLVPIPENLRGASFMFNRILDPSLTYTENVDFRIDTDQGVVLFQGNPFETGLIPIRDIVDPESGEVVDKEGGLWLYSAEFDRQYILNHFGYVIQVEMPTSQGYKDFVNAVWDSYVKTPHLGAVEELLAAVSGIPHAKTTGEIVEVIIETSTKKQVVTDLSVYTLPVAAEVTVSVGDELYAGQSLTDAVQIIELGAGPPDADTLPAVAVGAGFLRHGYQSELVFENKSVAIDYQGVDADNKAMITFQISGYPDDIDQYWENVHLEGKARGKVLADFLDTRTDPVGPPLPENLPLTINPLEYALGTIMANNLFFIKLKPQKFADDAIGSQFLNHLRNIVPPQTTYLVYVETTLDTEYIDPTAPGDAEHPGAQEELSNYDSSDPLIDYAVPYGSAAADQGWVRDMNVIVREVAGKC